MSAARDSILSSIRQSLARAKLPATELIALAAPRPPDAALVEAFAREVEEVNGTVHGPMPAEKVAETILDIVHTSGASELLSWAFEELPVAGLAEAGLTRTDSELPAEPAERNVRLAEMERAGVGLTGALGGLADTGTLVLACGPGRPRLAWLLPPTHVALLPVESIYPSMAAFLVDCNVAKSSHLAFVTGPSRTADIELTLTRGVHGPKSLHVVLIAEKSSS